MNYLNGINFNEVIGNLSQIRLNLWEMKNTTTNALDKIINNSIDTLDKIINNQLTSLTTNTIFAPLYVDIYAFKYTLEEYGTIIKDVTIKYEYNDGEISETYFPTEEILNCVLKVYYSRYAVDGNGFHVGYENVLFTFHAINRMKLGLTTGYPGNLSSWVVNPYEFEITMLDTPEIENPSYEDHEYDCEIFKDNDNKIDTNIINHDEVSYNCTCGLIDNWNGYYPPDEDFFYQEMENIIYFIMTNNKLPDATFDSNTDTWNIADQISYKFK